MILTYTGELMLEHSLNQSKAVKSFKMKKLIFSFLTIAILIVVVFSCKKEIMINKLSPITKFPPVVSNTKIGPGGIVIVRCTPHRKKYDCMDGWGLCNCQFLPDAPWNSVVQTDVITDTTMSLVSESFVNNGQNILYVDSDLILPKEVATENNCKTVTILEGEYQKMPDNSVIVNIRMTY